MMLRPLFAASALVLASAAAAQADTFTSLGAFAAAVPNAQETTAVPTVIYDTTSIIGLITGQTITTPDSLTVLQPGNGWSPWSNGYTGDIFASSGATETLTFSVPLTAFALDIAPDISGPGNTASVTVTLSDGTVLAPAPGFTGSLPAFFGYKGTGITSLTITTSAPDFAFGDLRSVPAPAGLGLLGVAVGVLASVRRK